MSMELPDWLRGFLLLGRDGAGNIIPIVVDAAGQINVLLRGEDALGTVRTVRVDNVGQLYAILRGAGGNDVSVDAAGNLAAILKGIDGLGNLRTLLVDGSGQAIMVPRGNSGNYLDVDASGYLTAILKGLYGGALHTIAVDVNGRIEAFTMDAEDQWGQILKVGSSELAARLGSLRTLDWRGQTLYLCDFAHGIPTGYFTGSGLGYGYALDPTYWQTAGYALKLIAGSTINHNSSWALTVGRPPALSVGVECEWSYWAGGVEYHTLTVVDTATTRYQFGIGVDITNQKLIYYNDAGAWIQFANCVTVALANSYNRIKVVGDLVTGHYKRGLFNGVEYDMSAYLMKTAAPVSIGFVTTTFYFQGRNAVNDWCWLDNFIFTVNEP